MPEGLKEWWPLIVLLTPLVLGAIVWAIRKGLASKDDLAAEARTRAEAMSELEDKLNQLDRRTLSIEADVKHLPTTEDFGAMREQLARVGSAVDNTARELDSINRALNRVEDHLMKRTS